MSSIFINVTKPPLLLPSRLFLYGLHVGPDGHARSAAAVGLVDSTGFDIAHVYQPGTFGIWSGVYRATRGGIRWLLFLNWDGRAATGTIDGDFGFVPAKSYSAGEHFGGWRSVAVDGNGELLLTVSSANGIH